ncbi:MAG TPA: hypothetical protein VJ927_12380 [Actinomycetota bacterium]|nr:hypothetical protein [Actinomycetota bacterium]
MIASALRSRIESRPYRFAVGVGLAAAVILVYGILALGLVGQEGDPFDRIYAAVLGVGIVGAFIARFRPDGMAGAMFASALAMAAIAVIALVGGKHESPATSIPELLGLHGMFIVLFVVSGHLFKSASQERASGDRAGELNG